ncbi:MAG: peroxiredoxin [Acidimicrobiales bacterium]
MKPGDTAPDFELPDETGTPRRLTDLLADGPVVLFFYPIASSPGCTAEACHFRDLAAEFANVGAQRLGVSSDHVDRQQRFSAHHDLGYPLLSDADRTVATQFGVKRALGLPFKRVTFVVDTDRTVLDVIASEINMNAHADRALEALHRRHEEKGKA